MVLEKVKNYPIEDSLEALNCALNNVNPKGLKVFLQNDFIEPLALFEFIQDKVKSKAKRFPVMRSDSELISWLLKNAASKKWQLREKFEKVFFDFERLKYIGCDAHILCGFEPINTIHDNGNLLFSFDSLGNLAFEIEPKKNYYPDWFQVIPWCGGSINFCIDENLLGVMSEVVRIAKIFDAIPYVKIYDSLFNATLLLKACEFLLRSGNNYPFLFTQSSETRGAFCELENCFTLVMPVTADRTFIYSYQLI
jgi:hypothetical protein